MVVESCEILEAEQLKKILPHAYPFLLIDRVIEVKKGKSLVAIKNITANEWCFGAPGPDLKYFPETLLIEAAAQAALVLYHVSKMGEGERPRYVLGKVMAQSFKPVNTAVQLQIIPFADKMLDSGGYSNIKIFSESTLVAHVTVFYKVEREK